MHDPFADFFAPAQNTRLTPEEKNAAWKALEKRFSAVRDGLAERHTSDMTPSTPSDEHFFGCTKDIKLSAKERDICADNVMLFVKTHPVRPKTFWERWMPPTSFLTLAPALIAVLAVFATMTVGVVAAAEGSVPGDMLYGVKIGFTEPMVSLFAHGAGQEQWNVRRMERRLLEAERLALVAMDDPGARAQLTRHMEDQERYAQRLLEQARTYTDPERAAAFQQQVLLALNSHEALFRSIAVETQPNGELIAFADRLGAFDENVDILREEALAAGAALAQAKVITQRTEEIEREVERLQQRTVGDEDNEEMREDIRQMQREITAAKNALEKGDLALADELVRAGRRRARAAVALPSTAGNTHAGSGATASSAAETGSSGVLPLLAD